MAVVSMERPVPGLAWSWRQLGGLCGVVFVILFVIGVIVSGDLPTIDDSASEAQKWFADNGQQFLVGDFLIAIAVVIFFVPFFCRFRGLLREAEQGGALWSLIMLIGALF